MQQQQLGPEQYVCFLRSMFPMNFNLMHITTWKMKFIGNIGIRGIVVLKMQ